MRKTVAIKIDENHPIHQEKNKTQVILDALNLYYATKAVITGTIKLRTIQVDTSVSDETQKESGLSKNKKAVRSFLDAFSKL